MVRRSAPKDARLCMSEDRIEYYKRLQSEFKTTLLYKVAKLDYESYVLSAT